MNLGPIEAAEAADIPDQGGKAGVDVFDLAQHAALVFDLLVRVLGELGGYLKTTATRMRIDYPSRPSIPLTLVTRWSTAS